MPNADTGAAFCWRKSVKEGGTGTAYRHFKRCVGAGHPCEITPAPQKDHKVTGFGTCEGYFCVVIKGKSMTIEETLRIALDAHEGQKDLVGNPAILHLMAVSLAGTNELERKAGLLHDIVEDTDTTLGDLLSKGVEKEVIDAVDLLTHRDSDSYEDYVRKIVRSRNHTAIQVKLNDLHHNLQRAQDALRSRQSTRRITDENFALILDALKKHIWAEKYIRQHLYLPLTA